MLVEVATTLPSPLTERCIYSSNTQGQFSLSAAFLDSVDCAEDEQIRILSELPPNEPPTTDTLSGHLIS